MIENLIQLNAAFLFSAHILVCFCALSYLSHVFQNEVRISHRSEAAAIAKGVPGPLDLWHHVSCFNDPGLFEEYGWLPSYSGERLTGFSALKKEDQKMLKKELPA